MTDRELLELAAKAAGYSYAAWNDRYECQEVWNDGDQVTRFWQPHRDDGDALRLRNRLHAIVADEGDCCYVEISRYGIATVQIREHYERDLDGGFSSDGAVDAATRRAIVRAAAAIAQQSQGEGG